MFCLTAKALQKEGVKPKVECDDPVIILSHNIRYGIIYWTWRNSSRNEKNDLNLKVGHIWF